MNKKLLINSGILSLGVLVGRFSGYIRELIIAYKYGVKTSADEIILILTVPDLLNNLLAGGVVSGIIIPILSKNTNREAILVEFTKKITYIFFILYLIVCGIMYHIYEFYLFLMISISLVAIFPNILTMVSSSYLQFENRYKRISLNTLVFNLGIILLLINGIVGYYFAVGVVLASIIRMCWVYFGVKKTSLDIIKL